LDVVEQGWTDYNSEESLLVLGFVEDWAKGVSPQDPYPSGAVAASQIAYSTVLDFVETLR
jgi:hypothetical protein